MPITSSTTGQTFSDQEVADWMKAYSPTDAQNGALAQRAAELGLNKDQITTALSIGRNGNQDPANVDSWVNNTPQNGYQWNDEGIIVRARTKPAPRPPTNGNTMTAPQLGTPTRWDVTPEQTVEGRVASIMRDRNNPLMVQARTGALESMNARGLANSSLAVSAGETAAYQAAVPIAQADASTFAKAAGYNADQSNQFAVKNADLQSLAGQANLQSNTQLSTAQLNADTQRYLAGLDNASRERVTQLQSSNSTLLNSNQQAAQAFNQAVVTVGNINMSTTMDADTKTRAVAGVWRDVQNQLRVLGSVAGLDLTRQLSFAGYPGFDNQGNWVGFEDGPGAYTRGTAPAPAPTPAPTPAPNNTGNAV